MDENMNLQEDELRFLCAEGLQGFCRQWQYGDREEEEFEQEEVEEGERRRMRSQRCYIKARLESDVWRTEDVF